MTHDLCETVANSVGNSRFSFSSDQLTFFSSPSILCEQKKIASEPRLRWREVAVPRYVYNLLLLSQTLSLYKHSRSLSHVFIDRELRNSPWNDIEWYWLILNIGSVSVLRFSISYFYKINLLFPRNPKIMRKRISPTNGDIAFKYYNWVKAVLNYAG